MALRQEHYPKSHPSIGGTSQQLHPWHSLTTLQTAPLEETRQQVSRASTASERPLGILELSEHSMPRSKYHHLLSSLPPEMDISVWRP